MSSCLVHGLGLIKANEYCFVECQSQMQDVVQSMGSGLVDVHMQMR